MENFFDYALLNIKYDGEVSSINALTISDAIKANYQTLKKINDILNIENSIKVDIQLKIKPFKKGSFIENWEIIAPLVPILPELFRHGRIALKVIDCYLKFIEFKKFLKGQDPVNVTDTVEGIKVENNSGEVKIINPIIYKISGDFVVNNYSSDYFDKIDSDRCIERVIYQDENGKKTLEVSKNDMVYLRRRIKNPINQQQKIKKDNVIISIRVDLNNKKKITFYIDGHAIDTEINDQDFIDKVSKGELFATGDTLIVDGFLVQEFDSQINAYLNKIFVVNKIKEHKHIKEDPMIDFYKLSNNE